MSVPVTIVIPCRLYYLSPFSWTIRAWALVEFKSDSYTPTETELSLDSFQFKHDNHWIGFGILYNLCFYVFWIFACSVSAVTASLLSV